MRILIWNVCYRAKAEALLPALMAFDADVMMLQELTTDSKYNPGVNIPQLICQEGYHSFFQETRQFGNHQEGSGIFSRQPFECTKVAELRRGGTGRGRRGNSRLYLEADIPGKNRITVGLAHLSYRLPFGQSERQAETHRLLGELKKPHQRFIFGGDFNAPPKSKLVAEVSKLLTPVGPDYKIPSWMVFGPGEPPVGRRLDYAFASSDLKATAWLEGQAVSNHRPLVVEVDLA